MDWLNQKPAVHDFGTISGRDYKHLLRVALTLSQLPGRMGLTPELATICLIQAVVMQVDHGTNGSEEALSESALLPLVRQALAPSAGAT